VTPLHPERVISDHPERFDTRLMLIAADYPFMDVFWSILVFFLWVAWLMVLFRIIGDIFRRHDASGWVKAAWIVFVIVLPFLGVLVYLIAQGQDMARRDMEQAAAARAEFDDYVRSVARSEGQQPTSTPPSA
jgi:predicted PurR-regulated permease PerM